MIVATKIVTISLEGLLIEFYLTMLAHILNNGQNILRVESMFSPLDLTAVVLMSVTMVSLKCLPTQFYSKIMK